MAQLRRRSGVFKELSTEILGEIAGHLESRDLIAWLGAIYKASSESANTLDLFMEFSEQLRSVSERGEMTGRREQLQTLADWIDAFPTHSRGQLIEAGVGQQQRFIDVFAGHVSPEAVRDVMDAADTAMYQATGLTGRAPATPHGAMPILPASVSPPDDWREVVREGIEDGLSLQRIMEQVGITRNSSNLQELAEMVIDELGVDALDVSEGETLRGVAQGLGLSEENITDLEADARQRDREA